MVFRRLRSCFKHPCGCVGISLFFLSVIALLILPQYVRNDAITRFVSVNQERDIQSEILSTRALTFPVTLDNVRLKPLNTTKRTKQFPAVSVTITSATKNSSNQESSLLNNKIKNESLNIETQKLNNFSVVNKNVSKTSVVPKKLLIYICDHRMYCYGLGDRQRGLVSVYILAEVTNRDFGIIMTAPSNFTEFYKPNLVPWDIPQSKLAGRSSVEIVAYGPRVNLGLQEIDFNAVYPQDVVYIKTNQKWQLNLLQNHHYRNKFPQWTKVATWQLFQTAWLRLVTPTETLRVELNNILSHITQEMQDEYNIWKQLNNTKCCDRKQVNTSFCANSTCVVVVGENISCCNVSNSINLTNNFKQCSNGVCEKQNKSINCSNTLCKENNKNDCKNNKCSENVMPTTIENITNFSNECVQIVKNSTQNVSEFFRKRDIATRYCSETRPVLAPWASVENIHQSKGFETVNLNLVCVHIRVGHSATLPFENNVRNKPETVTAVWDFLKPLVLSGRHVYLATDSQQVREQAKAIFGSRVHVSSVPIIHIAVVHKGEDERSAFRLTLVEQLLLATSCKTLVISYSGFSMKAAQIRDQLQGGAWELYMFKSGSVGGKGVKWLQR